MLDSIRRDHRCSLRLNAVIAVMTAFVTVNGWAADDKVAAVSIANVPLPVTGDVNATVSGTVDISSLPPVSIELPSQPFFNRVTLTTATPSRTLGVSGQRLAVTTLVITNFDTTPQALNLINPVINGSTCSDPVIGGTQPQLDVLLEPRKTLQIQFPTPLIFSRSNLGCIAFQMASVLSGGSVQVAVVGFVTP
jgi:hypothetical protein